MESGTDKYFDGICWVLVFGLHSFGIRQSFKLFLQNVSKVSVFIQEQFVESLKNNFMANVFCPAQIITRKTLYSNFLSNVEIKVISIINVVLLVFHQVYSVSSLCNRLNVCV